jgi:hypothetical protein
MWIRLWMPFGQADYNVPEVQREHARAPGDIRGEMLRETRTNDLSLSCSSLPLHPDIGPRAMQVWPWTILRRSPRQQTDATEGTEGAEATEWERASV